MNDIKNMNWFKKLCAVICFWIKTYSDKVVEELVTKVQEANFKTSELAAKLESLIKENQTNLNRIKSLEVENAAYLEEVKKCQASEDKLVNKYNTDMKFLKDKIAALESTTEEYAEAEPVPEECAEAPVEAEPVPEEVTEAEPALAKPTKKKKTNKRKLDCPKIKAARKRVKKGELVKDIAAEYDVDDSTLTNALKGRSYKECK